MRVRPALALLLAVALATPSGSAAAEPQASLPDIEDEVMCPICGTLLELSESPQAERERELIRGLIDDGRSKDEIKDALVAEYGEEVLAAPDDSGFDLAAWVLPALGIAAGVGVVAAFALRGGRRGSAEDAPALDPAEAKRLDEDISRYEL